MVGSMKAPTILNASAETNSGASARGKQWQLALLWLHELREGADMADIITFNSVLAAFDGSGQHLGDSVFLLAGLMSDGAKKNCDRI